ncbi:MAG: hypothetical protein COB33_012125 [Thiotrichaceae bacterium]|nr:hypothetical protein [Thiotrichaceae bacterium]
MLIIISLFISSCAKNDLVYFANNFEEIAKTDNTVPTLSTRLLKLREHGECFENKCPQEAIYVAVSEFGEYPDQKLYITPKANEWLFTGWKHIPKLGEDNPTIIFTLKSINNEIQSNITVKANLFGIEYINE